MKVSQVNLEEITMTDINNICFDILKNDPKTCKNGKIKSPHSKKLTKLSEELYQLKYNEDKKIDINKLFEKYSKVINKIVTLKPKMQISRVDSNDPREFEVRQSETGATHISYLKLLFINAKNNEITMMNELKQQKKQEEEQKRIDEEREKRENDPERKRRYLKDEEETARREKTKWIRNEFVQGLVQSAEQYKNNPAKAYEEELKLRGAYNKKMNDMGYKDDGR